jgi:RING-H2 zinc finger domain
MNSSEAIGRCNQCDFCFWFVNDSPYCTLCDTSYNPSDIFQADRHGETAVTSDISSNLDFLIENLRLRSLILVNLRVLDIQLERDIHSMLSLIESLSSLMQVTNSEIDILEDHRISVSPSDDEMASYQLEFLNNTSHSPDAMHPVEVDQGNNRGSNTSRKKNVMTLLHRIPCKDLNHDPSIMYCATVTIGETQIKAKVLHIGQVMVQSNSMNMTLSNLPIITAKDYNDGIVIEKDNWDIVIIETLRDLPSTMINYLSQKSPKFVMLIDDGSIGLSPNYPIASKDDTIILLENSIGCKFLRMNQTSCSLSLEVAFDRECSMCCEKMDKIIILPSCRHIFHDTCGARWLNERQSCPLCRMPV